MGKLVFLEDERVLDVIHLQDSLAVYLLELVFRLQQLLPQSYHLVLCLLAQLRRSLLALHSQPLQLRLRPCQGLGKLSILPSQLFNSRLENCCLVCRSSTLMFLLFLTSSGLRGLPVDILLQAQYFLVSLCLEILEDE